MELFLDAARELMNTNATDFTVQEVVERSGQSLRTFYQYFAGKYELLLALFEESIEGAAAELETVVAEHDDRSSASTRSVSPTHGMCRTNAPGAADGPRARAGGVRPAAPHVAPRRRPRTRSSRWSSCCGACSRRPRPPARCAGLDLARITGVVLQATISAPRVHDQRVSRRATAT